MPKVRKKGKAAPDVVLRAADVELPAQSVIGRPSTYDEAKALRVCELVAQGKSLRAAAEHDKSLPAAATFIGWCHKNPALAEHYARARATQMQMMSEQIVEIADSTDAANVNVARLQVETRKWLMSKLAPKQFGDRVTLAGDADAPLMIAWAGDDMPAMIEVQAQDITSD
jgi:hypothetical protein